jgi:DNA-binding response OmpR family regulator
MSLRVLVVDDDRDMATSLTLLLRLWGHEAAAAHDARAALDVAIGLRPDVVLLDVGLPGGVDGCELARRLRRSPDAAGAQLWALTGRGGETARCRSLEAGCDRHLVKPVEPAELRRMLESGWGPHAEAAVGSDWPR